MSNRTTPSSGDALTEREQEILELVADGKSNQDVAAQLSITEETVKSHLQHILDKLNVESVGDLQAELKQRVREDIATESEVGRGKFG
jgi:DNA-binding NarL/FixJ family response regulator